MEDLKYLEGLESEIRYLKNRSKLLDEILKFWNPKTLTFEIPLKWKNLNRLSKEQRTNISKSPRHVLLERMEELLSFEDKQELDFYN